MPEPDAGFLPVVLEAGFLPEVLEAGFLPEVLEAGFLPEVLEAGFLPDVLEAGFLPEVLEAGFLPDVLEAGFFGFLGFSVSVSEEVSVDTRPVSPPRSDEIPEELPEESFDEELPDELFDDEPPNRPPSIPRTEFDDWFDCEDPDDCEEPEPPSIPPRRPPRRLPEEDDEEDDDPDPPPSRKDVSIGVTALRILPVFFLSTPVASETFSVVCPPISPPSTLASPDEPVFDLTPDDESPPSIDGRAFERTLFTSVFVAPDAELTSETVSFVKKLLIIPLISMPDTSRLVNYKQLLL